MDTSILAQQKKLDEFLSHVKKLVAIKQYDEAHAKIQTELVNTPHQKELLSLSIDIYRALRNFKKSLKISKLLIINYPDFWEAYKYEIEDLIKLGKLKKAQQKVNIALKKFPDKQCFLHFAIKIYRSLGNYDKSLKCSELFIIRYPKSWKGYMYASQDKMILGTFQLDDYKEHLKLTRPSKKNGPIRSLWKYLYCVKPTKKVNLWIKSYELIRQPYDIQKLNQPVVLQPFQFWSQGVPPRQIEKITLLWNQIFASAGIPPIKLFNRETALEYINKSCPELVVPFTTAFTYAVQADVFRVAFASRNNCIWLDSDLFPNSNTANHLKDLLVQQKTTLFFRWYKPWLTNAFFISLSSSAFFGKIIQSNLDTNFDKLPKNKDTILETFGPSRYNYEMNKIIKNNSGMLESDAKSIYLEKEKIMFTNDYVFASMRPPYKLKYKNTDDNWQKFVGIR